MPPPCTLLTAFFLRLVQPLNATAALDEDLAAQAFFTMPIQFANSLTTELGPSYVAANILKLASVKQRRGFLAELAKTDTLQLQNVMIAWDPANGFKEALILIEKARALCCCCCVVMGWGSPCVWTVFLAAAFSRMWRVLGTRSGSRVLVVLFRPCAVRCVVCRGWGAQVRNIGGAADGADVMDNDDLDETRKADGARALCKCDLIRAYHCACAACTHHRAAAANAKTFLTIHSCDNLLDPAGRQAEAAQPEVADDSPGDEGEEEDEEEEEDEFEDDGTVGTSVLDGDED